MNQEDESISSPEHRLPYHAPRPVSLGSVQSLVQGGGIPGSDGGLIPDCLEFI
jgi:hypothetical protein